jgi:sugar lactone lactonase YvrE
MKHLPFWIMTVVGPFLGLDFTAQSQSYRFTTLAGNPGQAASADGTNSAALFNFPSGIAVDATGNLYVGDTSNQTIRKVTPVGTDWVVTTIAGLAGSPGSADGTNSDARFYNPNGVAVDNGGSLYVVDHRNHTIRQITPLETNWVVTTIAGTAGVKGWADGTNGAAQFWSPTGICVDADTNLYVADSSNYIIRKITPVGTNWVTKTIAGWANHPGFANGANALAQFNAPYDVALDKEGNLYVPDYYVNNVIRKITPVGSDWVVSTIAGTAGSQGSQDGMNANASFHWPIGIAVDAAGNLFVSDQFNNTIRQITPLGSDWETTTVGGLALNKGSNDGIDINARFYEPWGIKVDSAGNLFVVDWHNSTIRMGVPGPAMQITLAGGQAIITWPSSATNYVLEASGDVGPAATWTSLTNGITTVGLHFVFTNDLSGAATFYRLRKF